MIADYLYNTPMPTGAQCVLVLLKQQYGNRSDFTSDIIGKTPAGLSAVTNVLGYSAPSATRQFGFSRTRKTSGAYAGSTSGSNFEIPPSATFTITRDGKASAIAACLVVGGVIVRGAMSDLQLSGGESQSTRLVFSIDDAAYVCKVVGPAFNGSIVGETMVNVVHDAMVMAPAFVSGTMTASVVHQPMPADAILTAGQVVSSVVHEAMSSVALPVLSSIDKSTIQADFKPAVYGTQYTLSTDEKSLTKVGAADSSSRCFEVTGKGRPGAKCYMRFRRNGTAAGYICLAVSTGLITPDNQVAWSTVQYAANTWVEIKIEHISGNIYSYVIGGSELYRGTATRLTFYGHTSVTTIDVDVGQMGTTLPDGYVWL